MLRSYVDLRIAVYDTREQRAWEEKIAQSEAVQQRMWSVVAEAVKAAPEFDEVLLPAFNDLIDLHGSRVSASRRHLPGMLLILLLSSSAVAVGAVGYGCGVAGKRNVVLTTALAFLIAGTLWAIIDMDHPRVGLIRVGQQPMLDLQTSLGEAPAPTPEGITGRRAMPTSTR